jgi:peptide methionine sulfoxide reductase MsrA
MEQINNNSTMVKVNSSTAEAAVMVEKLYNFFCDEDEHERYLQDMEEIFSKLMVAVQDMIGSEACWSAIDNKA